MHIITGLLLAGLLGRKAKPDARNAASCNQASWLRSPLLKTPSVLSVTHALPGRTRFRLPALAGLAGAAAHLRETLVGIEGIHEVEVNSVSGSVLIEHDARRIFPDLLAAALVRLMGLENQMTGRVESSLGRELREFSRAVDRATYEKTGGLLDMKTALYLALAGLGVRELLKGRSPALPTGFTLMWWAANGLLGGRQRSS